MKVKKDTLNNGAQGSQPGTQLKNNNGKIKAVANKPTTTKPTQAPNSLYEEDGMDFMEEMMNDPQFYSMMQQSYTQPFPGYQQTAANIPMQYADNYGMNGMYTNPNFMPFLYPDEDDEDDDDISNLMTPVNANPFATSTATKPSANTKKDSRPTSFTQGPSSANVTGSGAPSPTSGTGYSGQNSPSSSVSLGNDYASGSQLLDESRNSGTNKPNTDQQRNSSFQSVVPVNSQNIATSSATMTQNTNAMPIIYTDPNALQNVAAVVDISPSQQQPITLNTAIQPFQAATSGKFPSNLVLVPTNSLSPGPTHSPHSVSSNHYAASVTSPDSVNTSPSPLPADMILQTANVRGRSKGNNIKTKRLVGSTDTHKSIASTSKKRKTKEENDTPKSSGIKFTPVETITNIVPIDPEKESILKEVISKPIKHQTEINVDSAHNRSVKNAINARVNRQKHKQFVQSLEDENNLLRERIHELEKSEETAKTEKDILKQEISYLKSVIANETSIGKVLTALNDVKDVRLSSGFATAHRKRAADSTVGEEPSRPVNQNANNNIQPGVCLHVHDQNVSIEFCEKCANMSALGRS